MGVVSESNHLRNRTLNSILSRLGYGPSDRVVVIHADDVSLCQASLDAFSDLIDFGLVSSGSLMVPCPWFPATARFCQAHPDVDMGVHITLNCEWESYRWRPVSTFDPATGLVDADGYSPRSVKELWENIIPSSAIHEVKSQVSQALSAGVDVTHIDEHMGAILHPSLLPLYTDFVLQLGLPIRWKKVVNADPEQEWQVAFDQQEQRLLDAGFALFDFTCGLSLDDAHNQPEFLREQLAQIPPGGLSLIVGHPAKDTPELRAICPDWPARVANYEAFMCPDTRQFARDQEIQIIGFRTLREALRVP